MRAAVSPQHGAPDIIEVRDVPVPDVGPGEVRVRIAAAAVNLPDILLMADRYQVSVPPPFIPGSEFCGTVEEIGPGVVGVEEGDRVIGTSLVGAFAEQVVVPNTSLTPIPAGIDDRTAAAFGVAHRTAYHVLRSVAAVGSGDEIVVLGAGGGVGLAAVQLGVALGNRVTGVAGTDEKVAVVRAKGAVHVIHHGERDLREALRTVLPDGADAVVDPVGGSLAEPALRSLRPGGRFVTVGYASGEIPRIPLNLVLLKGVAIHGFQFVDFARREPEALARNEVELHELLASGRVVPHVGAVFPLDEAAAALTHVADRRAIGKVVIEVRCSR